MQKAAPTKHARNINCPEERFCACLKKTHFWHVIAWLREGCADLTRVISGAHGRERDGDFYIRHIFSWVDPAQSGGLLRSRRLSHTHSRTERVSRPALSRRGMGILKHRDMQSSLSKPPTAQGGRRPPQTNRDHLCSPPRAIFVSAAFQHVRESLSDLVDSTGAQDTDLIFLQGLMDSPVVCSLVKVSFHARDQSVCFYWFRRCF